MREWYRRTVLFSAALIASLAAATAAEREFQECPDCPELVVIPAGDFDMGSPDHEAGRFDTEGPRHPVPIKAFALGKYDVTVEQFLTFLRQTGYQPVSCNHYLDLAWHSPGHGLAYPPSGVEAPGNPAACLSWDDAQAYLAWLNAKVRGDGKGPYRLPSEAEWEYAARAGTRSARWWGEDIGDGKANCNGCGSRWDDTMFAPVGSFGPNPFGLYDMLGNVWQWTADCWHDSYSGAPKDGGPWLSGNCPKRVLRGGSWSSLPIFIRAAARTGAAADGSDADYATDTGFRVARTIR
ncbi:MAG TPA: formylglycine-generating enzyme family protein [Candidatus Sulfotelmatobacter sp.]|jgi:formylglycine-generating enzyme required for sulfatase activity|nr:formylglycine-generating enzyme family protein [Candidatus Sulfotelmatobacter sp.]